MFCIMILGIVVFIYCLTVVIRPFLVCRVILEDDIGRELASFSGQDGCFRHDEVSGGFLLLDPGSKERVGIQSRGD
jgi:hypothetical protein